MDRVVEQLTLSGNDQVAPPSLVEGIERLTTETSIGIERLLFREEPWRQFAFLIQKKLQQTLQDKGYRSAADFGSASIFSFPALYAWVAARICHTDRSP